MSFKIPIYSGDHLLFLKKNVYTYMNKNEDFYFKNLYTIS